MAVGGAMLGRSWLAWAQGAPLDSPGLSLINAGGWLSVMGGSTLVVLPLIARN